ncbi:MAG: IS5/IS1182 family transposase, partial [Symploca sp. SIO2E6]|nr:IS5/IS1182 family transposase [Symploca sp. SIO2E6]
MLSDASCVPGDIRYPNDLGILNEARVGSEEIIDTLYEAVREKINKKPKTYRKLARKDYLKVAKKRKPRTKQRKKAIKKQLQYLQRNLGHIERL